VWGGELSKRENSFQIELSRNEADGGTGVEDLSRGRRGERKVSSSARIADLELSGSRHGGARPRRWTHIGT